MAYDYIDLFEEFGITAIEASKPSKQVNNKSKAVSSNKKTATEKKQEGKIKIPVTVYTGYTEPIQILKGKTNNLLLVEDNSTAMHQYYVDENEMTMDDLHSLLSEKLPGYPKNITVLQKGKKNSLYLIHNHTYMVEKATIQLKENTRLLLGDTEVELSAVKTSAECEVSCDELKKHFSETFPDYSSIGFIHSSINNVLVPSFRFPMLKEEVSFPVSIEIFGRGGLIVTRDEYSDFVHLQNAKKTGNSSKQEENNEDEDSTEDEETEDEETEDEETEDVNGDGENTEDSEVANETNEQSKAAALKADPGMLLLYVVNKYPDFDDEHLELQWNNSCQVIIAKMIEKVEKKNISAPDETYPTDAMVSLLYTSFRMTPELFGGKPRVSKEELREYIERERPEYSKERTDISYDKEKNLVVVVCRGSRKGIDLVFDDEIAFRRIESSKDTLFNWQMFDGRYRAEKTSTACIVAPIGHSGDGSFKYYLPKISAEMLNVAKQFFLWIYMKYGTEVMIQLFWDSHKKQYFWNVPYQRVSIAECHVDRDIQMEMNYSLIADFHSHGCYNAFFSYIDDQDELGFRVYGVMGNMNNTKQTMALRAGTGGCFVNLNGTELFDNSVRMPNAKEMLFKMCREAEDRVTLYARMKHSM